MSSSIVLITGGNNGIGFETCLQFAQEPGIHVILGSRSLDKGEKALAQIQQQGVKGQISLVQLDVTDDKSISAAVAKIQSAHGRLDTLINNAGICPTDHSRESFRDAFEVNVISPSILTAAFAPLLEKSKSPRVIYVSSTLGSIGCRNDPSNNAYNELYKIYRVSKAALNMVRSSDAWEYRDKNFKVFAYCPGLVVSDLAGIRQQKMDAGIPGPEDSARGLMAIHRGKQDGNVGEFITSASVLKGEAVNPW